ncbi:restriction endonuclease subunit S [Entomomonas asaccharolytica]|uniref:Restriction endonuclease subunit S n=1 Tax=Entomomonas asaccharolytica TaxID=2785331 RepID=A0A974RY51_9GAMM|nr:restriction endonuclease subunit S [Entomomonas asaccharolytica]QQP85534.1 restriction endonuclease subunit S [Entomomonas asaccharolytica]
MLVPKLRFKEFGSSLLSNKIEDLAKITTGNKDTQDKDDRGRYPFYVRSQNIEKINSYSFDGEAILTAGDGVGVGKIYHYINGKFDFHQRVYCIYNFDKKILGKYLYYYFSEKFYNRVIRISAKNSVDSVRKDMIAKMVVTYPHSLLEQTKIAVFLTTLDTRINQQEKQCQLLEQYKRNIMQQIFSQQLRFKDDNGREFPEWESKILNDIGKSFNGLVGKSSNDFGKGSKYITYKQVFDNNKINLDLCSLVTVDDEQNSVQFGDIFFTISSETPNEIAYSSVLLSYPQEKVYLNSFCFGFRVNSFKILSPYFACYLFRSSFFRETILKLAQGSTRFNISKTSFLNTSILLPCEKEQTKIAKFLTAIDEKINLVKAQLEQLNTYKKGLLQQLFI